jgi:intracellular sulfur oxidation DsrE/DsrF family protein
VTRAQFFHEDNPMMRAFLGVATVLCATGWTAAQPPNETKLVFPIIPNVGGVVLLPKAAEQPRKGAKVVFDVTADAKPADANKGLERAARLLNLYGTAGLKANDVKVVVVLHGEATKAALTDAAYKTRFGADANPNLPLIRALKKTGVEVFVCGQALAYKGFQDVEVAGEATVAAAALTVVINRQGDGYAYVPVP